MTEPPEPRVELDARVKRFTFRADQGDFAVARLERPGEADLTAVGALASIAPGETVRLQGRWEDDPRFGRQLRVDGWLPATPETLEGIERYLASGAVDGVGPELARRLTERFGLDTFDVLDHHPERLLEVEGIGPVRARRLRAAWTEQRDARALMVLLRGHGLGLHLARRIAERFGPRALEVCRSDPYRLALEVPGVGFPTADRLARAQGLAHDDLGRVAAGAQHFLAEAVGRGHVARPEGDLIEETARRLEVPSNLVVEALARLEAEERMVRSGGRIYLPALHRAELDAARRLARRLARAVARPDPERVHAVLDRFERDRGLTLAPAQRAAVSAASEKGLVVVTGGPGTGKTTLVRALLALYADRGAEVRLAAPTGRAAKRLEEATGGAASTLHRLLEVDPVTGRFQRGDGAPIEADVVVVDEVSMVDLPLFASLLAALAPETRLVLVGDADQLPSVGPGRVLADLLEAEIPSVRLSEVFRQAQRSLIVANAHRINSGAPLEGPPPGAELTDFYVVERSDPARAVETMLEIVGRRIPARFALDPRRDVQVLVPVHKGPLGASALNAALQARLNPGTGGLERAGQRFRPGDKVMQTRNDYDLGVLNGEIGQVEAVDEARAQVTVRFEDDRVRYEAKDLEHLKLAYACSIHKAQGSEYPAVVLTLGRQHLHMLDRQLLYTAVTRARRLLVLITAPGVLAHAARPPRAEARVSGLVEAIRDHAARGP